MTAEEILKQLSLKEKIALCEGRNFWETKAVERLGLPSAFLCDGPHGLRKQEGSADMLGVNQSREATCFPTAVTTGASWDVALMERIGEAIGEEAAEQGVDVVLGPGANIKRNPLCGRNFEYVSEDPYLAGKMAAGMICGIQKNGTAASLKHFACNSQEFSRFNSDSVVDERTLREIYLTAFEIAVKEAKPKTVMCAYNKINDTHCSDSEELLTDILRREWGFDGLVVTDWGAMNDRVEGFKAGCDLNMPGGSDYMMKECLEAVKDGSLEERTVDVCARRIIEMALNVQKRPHIASDKEAHHALAREAAEQGAVLLKNNGVLPLNENQSVALIGAMAEVPRYQGSGSSHINPFRVVSPLEAMPNCTYAPGCDERGDTTRAMLAEAAKAAESVDVAVVFAGLPERYESEGFDRSNMKMPEGQLQLLEEVAKANPNTVVVLCCGSAVECSWDDQVNAILYMGLGGQAVGEAVKNLLYGRTVPSGKLTESWPLKYEDCVSSSYYGTKDAQYREGVYVGYRYYEKANIPVRWRFGYGLSYTTFVYSDLKAEKSKVMVTVTNSGKVAGAEVVQLYVKNNGSGYRPIRELKGFSKVFLDPGESKTVEFALDDRAYAIWDNGWVIPSGIYTMQVGDLSAEIELIGEKISLYRNDWYGKPQGTPSQKVWEAMLGRKYKEKIPVKGEFTMDNSVMEMKEHSLIMKIMFWAVESTVAKSFDGKKDYDNPEFKMMILSSAGGPLRSMQISGGMKGGLMQGLLEMANGHYFRGIKKMITG